MPNKQSKTSRTLTILCWVLFAVSVPGALSLLYSCSRSGHENPDPPERITIACAILPETALVQVAQVEGFFLSEGLTVKSHLHPYGKPALKDVLEGKADVATVAETPFMFAVLDGADISVIATIQSSTRNNAVIVRKDSGVSAPGDLKGKRIAVILGTTAEYFMDAFIARHGIARSEVDIVNLKPEEYQAALNNGRVDAIAIFEPYLSRAQDALGGSGMTFYDEEIYTETFNIVARKDFIRKNPGMVRKVLRALIRAEDYVRSDPSGAGNIIADYCGIDRRKAHQVLTNSHFGLTLDQSLILALEDESRWAIRAGLTRVSAVPNYLEYINPDGLAAVKPERVSILR